MKFVRHHRSYQSIVTKACELDIATRPRWTDEEEHKLSEYYETHERISRTELAELFPNRPVTQCINKASVMGLSKSKFNWDPSTLQQLKELYPVQGSKCAELIGCSRSACGQMAHKQGIMFIKPKASHRPERVKFAWTEEEDTLIKTTYGTNIEKVVSLLSNRTRGSIIARAKVLGVKADRTRRVKCIETNITYSLKDAAELVGKTLGAILYAIKHGSICGGYHWEYAENE